MIIAPPAALQMPKCSQVAEICQNVWKRWQHIQLLKAFAKLIDLRKTD